jgi:Carboxypeptidase regulatory-like domain
MKKHWICIVMVFTFCAISLSFSQTKESQDHTRTLIGHVLDRQDNPVSKAIVYLKNLRSLAVKTYISEPDGSYRFPALSPNADYEVYAEHDGARSDTKTLSSFDNRKEVNYALRLK